MKITSTLILALMIQFASGQIKEDQFFVFDLDWKPTKIKKAYYFLRVRQSSDSNYEWTYYQMNGPRIKQECFKDEKASIRNGKFTYYFQNGVIDSTGEYENDQINNLWSYGDPDGKIKRRKEFRMGLLIKDTSFEEIHLAKNPLLKTGDTESDYPGGVKGWQNYLLHNLHYPDRAVNAEIMGDVLVRFVIDSDGTVLKPEIFHSVEYSLDEEALRIILNSKKWSPEVHSGKKVKSYKVQPIRFRLQKG